MEDSLILHPVSAPASPGSARGRTPAEPTRRLRIAFCTDNLGIGGTELNAIRTAERLHGTRAEIELVLLGADGPLRARYEAMGITVHEFQIPNLYGREAVRQGFRFARFLRAARIDVLHCHDVYSNVFGSVWGRVARVPAIIVSRRWWSSLPQRKLRVANRIAYRLASRVLANSAAVGESVRTAEGVAAARIAVVPNFVESDAFEAPGPAARLALLDSLGVPAARRLVGIVARLDPVKDHRTLLQAFALLVERAPDAHLVVVGDGPMRSELESLACELGIGGDVTFAGMRANRPNLHHLFDVSVLTSRSEGFPNSIVEAMAAGRAVVATGVGGVCDAVADGTTGLLVQPGDAPAVAHALGRLLDAPETASRMGDAGRVRANALFGEEAVLSGLAALYQELVS